MSLGFGVRHRGEIIANPIFSNQLGKTLIEHLAMRLNDYNELIDQGVKIPGKWKINKNHEITYTPNNRKEKYTLKSTILENKPNSIKLIATQNQNDQTRNYHDKKLPYR